MQNPIDTVMKQRKWTADEKLAINEKEGGSGILYYSVIVSICIDLLKKKGFKLLVN